LVMSIQTLAVYAICAFLCLPLLWSITAEFLRDKLIFLIPAWAIVSTVWSQNPTISLHCGLFLAMNIALVFYLLEHFSYDGILRILVWVGSAAALASLLVIVVFPQYGLMSRGQYGLGAWEGIYGHKNICGEAMGLLLMPIFFAKIRNRYALLFRVFYVVLISIIIVMSRTVGAYIICASSVLLIVLMKLLAKMRRADAFALSVLLIAAALGAAIMAVDFAPDVLSILGKDPTLTGRTTIWGAVMMSILKKPLIGYGFKAFWQGLNGESANAILTMKWPGLSYSENGVLDLWLDLGGIGVALYVCVFLRAVKDAAYCLRRDASPFVMWCTLMLFTVVISNVEGGTLLFPSSLACILPITAFVGLRRERLRLKAADTPTPIAHAELGRMRHEATRLREPELV
jgi:exopolysaccharide production protein ExoQ